MMINVLIADDQLLVRNAISTVLSNSDNINITGEARTGGEVVKMARSKRIDVILMDLNLPEMSGLEATRRILSFSPSTKILVLTARRDDIYPLRLLRAGAVGYLTKGNEQEELINAIRCVVAGEQYLPTKVAKRLALCRFAMDSSNPFNTLSDRELEVMLMIVTGKQTNEIANELHLSPQTVNCYRHRLLKQLHVKNDVALTYLAARYNLIDVPLTAGDGV
ncbi:MAG: response regulator [Gammaproteobacteria bacterium]|nr:response regulator [Gammaproteobacteria bacterium]